MFFQLNFFVNITIVSRDLSKLTPKTLFRVNTIFVYCFVNYCFVLFQGSGDVNSRDRNDRNVDRR